MNSTSMAHLGSKPVSSRLRELRGVPEEIQGMVLTRRELFQTMAVLTVNKPLVGSVALSSIGALPFVPASAAAQTGAAGGPRRFTIGGSNYRIAVQKVLALLQQHCVSHEQLPVTALLDILPIIYGDDAVAPKLAVRGALSFTSHAISNTGAEIQSDFSDETLGRLTVYIPGTLAVPFKNSKQGLRLDFAAAPIRIAFRELDPQLRIGTFQRLMRIQIGTTRVLYSLNGEADPKAVTELELDLDLASDSKKMKASAQDNGCNLEA